MYDHVLVGTDRSATATRAVAAAARLAQAHNARLTIVHAFKSGSVPIAGDCPPEFTWRLSAGQVADEVVKDAARTAQSSADGDLEIQTRHQAGSPVTVLLHAIDALRPDAVVVGNADVGWLRVRRSVSQAIARRARIDVVVVDTRAA